MKNSRIVILLLIITIIASLYYTWQGTPLLPQINSDNSHPIISTDSASRNSLKTDRFDFSGGEQRKFSKPHRNLFNQLFPPPPAPKKVVAPPAVSPAPVIVAPVPVAPPMPIPIRTSASRMPSFQVLGFLEKASEITVFISLQDEIYLVKKEQMFADEFQVTELNSEIIRIARTTGAGEVSLPLSEKTAANKVSAGPLSRRTTRPVMPVTRPDSHPAIPLTPPPLNPGSEN